MLRPCFDIRIKNRQGDTLYFDYVHEGEIERTWQNLTQTARIVLPRKIRQLNGQMLNGMIQAGNEIVIRLGYDLEFTEEFRGYVVSVGDKIPMELICEDRMWLLKQGVVTKTYDNAKLSQIIKDIVPATIKTNVLDASVGSWRFSNVSPARILDELKDKCGMHSYFRNDVLSVGFAYPLEWAGNSSYLSTYHFQRNIIRNSCGLDFKAKEDIRIQVHAISMLSDNKQIKAEVGDIDGEQHTLHFYGITSEAELKKRAQAELDRMKYTGYRGSFSSYGYPYTDHGYTVELLDDAYAERRGKYLVDKVTVHFGRNGIKRGIFLGRKT